MARYRSYGLEFKRRVARQYLSGETALAALARPHEIRWTAYESQWRFQRIRR